MIGLGGGENKLFFFFFRDQKELLAHGRLLVYSLDRTAHPHEEKFIRTRFNAIMVSEAGSI